MDDEDLIRVHNHMTRIIKQIMLATPRELKEQADLSFPKISKAHTFTPRRLACVIIQAELDFALRPFLPQKKRSEIDGTKK